MPKIIPWRQQARLRWDLFKKITWEAVRRLPGVPKVTELSGEERRDAHETPERRGFLTKR
jgi:hypothetical protein